MSMAFEQLSDFLNNRMRMSHVYQPAMLIQLLQNGGRASATDIAKAILLRDPTQVSYYEEITKRMPGRVLTQNTGITKRERDNYYLKDFNELSSKEVSQLIELCQSRLDQFLDERNADPWMHRKRSSGQISSTLRYQVFERAKRSCELCSIHEVQKALEVDHIVPRSLGGGDDISNLQALCYSCNAMKRNTDDTDFRGVIDSYSYRKAGCEFCAPQPGPVLSMDELSYSVSAPSPISKGHTLFVPKRHIEDYFDLYQPELNAIQRNLEGGRKRLQESDASITGFTVVYESVRDTGPSVLHSYLGLIPRRSGDPVSNMGGFRGEPQITA